ncbi:MAG: tripartite tricarboxylate transporter substrate binding protein [Proteobacteria bacterium]|nr:tripartite tricarboxylate transporter substrate binding protein [Pseudomonadota bacterium]
MKKTARILATVAFAAAASLAQAQAWPSRPVKLVVPFSPGGFTDVVARILGQKLTESLGQPVIIENKPGAGSTIGSDYVAKSKPDGYTLVMVSTTQVSSPWLYKSMPYDVFKDFTPIMKLVEGPYVLVANPKLPVKSVAELLALAKAQPGKLDYASSGNGSAQHLVGAMFATMGGVNINHVPYKGSGQAMQDIVGGQVQLGFVGMPNALPYIPSGRLRALAVTTRKRSPDLPDVPTMDEAGIKGYDATIWLGLLGPAGLPRDIVTRLNSEITKALSSAETRKLILAAGVEVSTSSPEEFAALLRSEYDKWGKVVKETGATIN